MRIRDLDVYPSTSSYLSCSLQSTYLDTSLIDYIAQSFLSEVTEQPHLPTAASLFPYPAMAIFPLVTPAGGAETTPAIDVEAWTVEQAAERLQATTISSSPAAPVRGTSVTIQIPLDESAGTKDVEAEPSYPVYKREAVHTVHKRREPIRRDSLKRREALIKGKEGSRRRQRWENDRLLNNPHVQPPLPSDWEVRPTYPVQSVPYFLAPLWDAEYKYKAQTGKKISRPEDPRAHGTLEDQAASRVPRELKAKLRRSRAARGMLQDLEEEVRQFVERWEVEQQEMEKEGLDDADSEDEEIVFVGRNGMMSDERRKAKEEENLRRDKLIFESLADDRGAAFGYFNQPPQFQVCADWSSRRWLVHSIATYYGLETWSVTKGSRREAYVGLKTGKEPPVRTQLPSPLWGLV